MDAEKPFRLTARLATIAAALGAIFTLAAMTTRIQMDVSALKEKTAELERRAKQRDDLINEMHADIKVLIIQGASTQKQVEILGDKLWHEK